MNKNIQLAILSGILLGLPFVFPFLFFLAFFAWLPLLYLEEASQKHYNPYFLFNHAFLSFAIWNTLAYWWVAQAQVIGVILIIILNSLVLATVFWLVSITRKSLRISILFPLLIIWLGFEYFHTWWDLAWPWLNLGNVFASVPAWVQWYEFTGTRGGSLWIILINLSLFTIFSKDLRHVKATHIWLIALFGLPLLSSYIIFDAEEESNISKTFALIQPHLDPYTEKFKPENEKIHFTDFLSVADSLCKNEKTDFLLGPETLILQSIDEDDPESSPFYTSLLEFHDRYPKTNILIGVHSSKHIPKGKKESYNSALFLADRKPKFYHKTKLVPMFERIPFDKYLSFLNDYSLELGGYHGTYSSRNHTENFSTSDSINILPIVCFESVFGDYCAQRTSANNGFICMITNDGWWKNTPGYKHHFNFSRLRAIESRRHYIRIANNGISAHINSKGTVIAKSQWWKKETLTGKVTLLSGKTFYAEHGDYIGRIALFFAVLLLIFVKIRTYTGKNDIRTIEKK